MNNFVNQMNKITDLLQSKMLYAQKLQEYYMNKEQISTYDFKFDDKVYLNT